MRTSQKGKQFPYAPLSMGLWATVLLAGAVSAGDWKLSDSFTGSLTAVDRTGSSEESGLVAQVSPGIRLSGRGARASADVSYKLTASIGSSDTDPEAFTHNLLGQGRLEAVEDFFFIGANATARLVGNSASSGPVDAINFSDASQSYSLRITPEFRHRLNRYADIVSNNAIDYVGYSGDNSSDDGSHSTTLNLGVRSGRHFLPMDWSLDATRNETNFDDRDDTRTSYTVLAGYRFNPRWRLFGRVGYEKNDVLTAREDTDGSIWWVGGDWTPTPRTSVSAEYGERYLGNVYSATMRHKTRRTLLSLDLSRDISNRRSQQLFDNFFILVDDQGNIIIDPSTGNPIVVNIPDLQEIDEDFVNTQVRGAVTVTGRRTAVTLTGSMSNRDYELSSTSEDTYALGLSVSRQLGARYTATLGSSFTHADSDDGSDSDTYDVRLSLGRALSPRTRASLDVLHRDRNSSSSGDDYTENRIGISLSTSFL